MKRIWIVAAVAVASSIGISLGRAAEEGIDKAKAEAFDIRMFASPSGNKTCA